MSFTFNDLVRATLDHLTLDGTFETILPFQKWIFNEWFFNGERKQMPGGKEDTWFINYRLGDSAQYTEPGGVRNPEFGQHLVQATQPLVQMYFYVAHVEEELEQMGNRGPLNDSSWAIINSIQSRRQSEKLGFFKKLEEDFFELPTLTGTQKSLWGLPYHLKAITSAQAATATAAGAFQGANPLTHASAGVSAGSNWYGIDVTSTDPDYTDLQNYNFRWEADSAASVSLTETNLVRLSTAFRKLAFEGPLDMAHLAKPAFARFVLCTDNYMCDKFGIAARQQNDRLGQNVVAMLGVGVGLSLVGSTAMVNGLPVQYAPVLDSPDAENLLARGYHPLYGVNLDTFNMNVRPQKFMKKRRPASDEVHTPDVIVEYVDSVLNLRLSDRQKAGFNGSWISV